MSIENITSAILDEAAAESKQILNAAEVKRRAAIKNIEERTKIETALAIKEAEEEKEKIIARRKSVADIDSKKIVLGCKQELINKCFEEVTDYIISMNEDEYVGFLVELGKASGFTEGTLMFNQKERETVGAKVTAALNEAVSGGKFILSDETRNLRGGYMLQRGMIFINNSVEAVVEDKRLGLTAEVATILFPPEK